MSFKCVLTYLCLRANSQLQCEVFAGGNHVPGLKAEEALAYFTELRQLLELLEREEWSAYLHDYGKADNNYKLVQPRVIIAVLEKVREADKKNVFSVLKKPERDKKNLRETVLKQLKQLADRQN